jgi:hypothetical protein
MKGGGITVGGVAFSGREAAMDLARIHLPPNTYQCIGGMVYALSLISKVVVHQEDMMKREEHGERVKRTPMQSVQVLLVHTSYPPVRTLAKYATRPPPWEPKRHAKHSILLGYHQVALPHRSDADGGVEAARLRA